MPEETMELDLLPLLPLPAGGAKPLLIAGPCSAETEGQVLATAHALAQHGVKLFRAGVWKPRTKPGSFEGVGDRALPWLVRVKQDTGMQVATEVATARHAEACLKAGIDLLWVGARTAANPFAVQEIADALRGTDVPVMVKNPVCPDLELWIGDLQRLNRAGIRRLGAIHRGFARFGKHLYRNDPEWSIPIELRRRIPTLPLICDPSHIGGRRALIAPLCQQAMDMGFDGLIVESHIDPDAAWSDAAQQITPDELRNLLDHLAIRNDRTDTSCLDSLRRLIDACDKELIDRLSRRMEVCRQIGEYKYRHNMTVLQTERYSDLLGDRALLGTRCGLDAAFVKKLFEAIHEESVRCQLQVMHRPPASDE